MPIQSHLSFSTGCFDEYLLREFLALDMLCPELQRLVPVYNSVGVVTTNLEFDNLGPSALHWSRQYEYPWAIVNSNLNSESICLDAGTGYSSFKYFLSKRAGHVTGIDLNYENLLIAKKRCDKLGLKNIALEYGDIETYTSEKPFDHVYCLSVLEHIPDEDKRLACINNLLNLLKVNGTMLISFDIVVRKSEQGRSYIDEPGAIRILDLLSVENPFLKEIDCSSGTLATGETVIVACVLVKKYG